MTSSDPYSHIIKNFADGFDEVDASLYAGERGYLEKKKVHFFPVDEPVFVHSRMGKRGFEEQLRSSVGAHPIHVGIAGNANFEMMFATKARAAVLIDVNPNQRVMWDRIIEIIRHNPNRKQALQQLRFLDMMMLAPSKEDEKKYAVGNVSYEKRWEHDLDSPITNIKLHNRQLTQHEFLDSLNAFEKNEDCWLGSDERYAYINLSYG